MVFPAKSHLDAWRSCSQLVRGQVNVANEANPICSTFEASVGCAMCSRALLQRRIGPFVLTNASCRCCSFQCISLICWAYFSDIMVLPGCRKLWWIRWQKTTKQWPWSFFDASLTLGSALELLLGPTTELVIASYCRVKSTFCCTSQYDWEMIHCCYVE